MLFSERMNRSENKKINSILLVCFDRVDLFDTFLFTLFRLFSSIWFITSFSVMIFPVVFFKTLRCELRPSLVETFPNRDSMLLVIASIVRDRLLMDWFETSFS